MTYDLDRLLAALADGDRPGPAPGTTDEPEPRRRGRPPALTPAEVRSARRRRALPLAERPRVAELAAEFGVDEVTVRRALRAAPPYDWGEPSPRVGGPHRDRGAARFPPTYRP